MSRSAHQVSHTFADYLSLEAMSNVKHEFLDGNIYAMAGGTPDHAALAASASGLLFGQLQKSSCRVYDSDLRIRVLATGLATYPDVTIVCGPRQLDAEDRHTITNPIVIIEILSPSTAAYDAGEKFDHYQQIPSLQEYVLVATDRRVVEVRRRTDRGGWETTRAEAGAVVSLTSISSRLDVNELYTMAADPT